MASIPQTFRNDVFLSFRGEDTRKKFTSHLYEALERNGCDVFHDTCLPRGESIAPKLSEAINESRIFVAVFSTNYADSKWCLNELLQMMDCLHTNQQQIFLPVFLDVSQSDVGTQQGSFQAQFIHHEPESNRDNVPRWREALREAAQLPGLHLQHDANGNEGALVVQIVERIRRILLEVKDCLYVADLVGIESRRQELIPLLKPGSATADDDDDGIRVVAIYGPEGIGKTTVAKAAFNRLAIDFEARYCCFLPDVKTIFGEPNGKVSLQKKLISNLEQKHESRILVQSYHEGIRKIETLMRNKKVLLVLDDVDDEEQLKILCVNRGILGSGSRIIVTTRDVSSVEVI